MLLALLSALPTRAHEVRPAVADVVVAADGALRATLRLNLEALLAGIDARHDDTDDAPQAAVYEALRRLPPDRLEQRLEEFLPALLAGLRARADGAPLALALENADIPPVGDVDLARDSTLTLRGRLPDGARTLGWGWDAAFGNSVVRVATPASPQAYTGYLQSGDDSGPVALDGLDRRPTAAVLGDYIVVGFTHILPKGLDHILFVVGLFLLSPRLRPLLWQVTGFTLAHSVTLALGVLGWVALPAALVEPLIAASIVYVAVENLFTDRLRRWRPLVVFGFGLLHGLGFAGVLTGLGLPAGSLLSALLGFNIGVELGQFAVLGLCFVTVGWLRGRADYRRIVTLPLSALIALVGGYWFIARIV